MSEDHLATLLFAAPFLALAFAWLALETACIILCILRDQP